MNLAEALKALNLDSPQITVYLACLSIGSAKAPEIAKKTGILRSTTYGILAGLQEHGLVSAIKKDNITHYQAATPRQLVNLIEERKQRIEAIVPELEKLSKSITTKHHVELFEGKEGLKTVINDFLECPNETIYIIGFVQRWMEFSQPYASIYYRKKKERNIMTKAIVDKKEMEYVMKKKITGTEFRFLNNIEMNAECIIYRDKIAHVSFEEDNLHGIIIQDAEMARLQKQIFQTLWNNCEKSFKQPK